MMWYCHMGLIDLQLALRVKPRYGMSFKGRSNKIGILCKLLVPLTTFGTSIDGNGGKCFNTTKCFPKLINLLWQSSLFHSGCSLFSIVMVFKFLLYKFNFL